MINGTTSKILYFGAFITLIICTVGIVILAFGEHTVPEDLKTITAGIFGILAGAHIAAPAGDPVGKKLNGDE